MALTDEVVDEIRTLYRNGMGISDICRKLKVSMPSVYKHTDDLRIANMKAKTKERTTQEALQKAEEGPRVDCTTEDGLTDPGNAPVAETVAFVIDQNPTRKAIETALEASAVGGPEVACAQEPEPAPIVQQCLDMMEALNVMLSDIKRFISWGKTTADSFPDDVAASIILGAPLPRGIDSGLLKGAL